MKPSEVLENSSWCKGNYARDKDGCMIHIKSEDTVSFCMLGAVIRSGICPDGFYQVYSKLLKDGSICTFNDIISKN